MTLHASEILAGLPPVLTGTLVFCACGHTRDEHTAAGCAHVNAASKRFPVAAPCACRRFTLNPLLEDAEAFIAKTLNQIIRKEGIPDVSHADREDLTQVMLLSLWKASAKYDSRSHIRFGSYASFEVYNDAIDEIRSSRMYGRHGQHRVQPHTVRSDDDTWAIDPIDPLDEGDRGEGRLERVVAELTVDAPDAGDVALRWALAEDDRDALRTPRERRSATPGGAPRGTGSPAWASGLTALTTKEASAA